jgi:hypothetical protein
MPKAVELLRQGRNEELWQMCCGFLNLSLDEFMAIQKRLLMEQLELLRRCPLGEKIMRGRKPETVEEFRQLPLTTYADYCPELIEKREDVLPAKSVQWVHTSGRSGEYPCKWVPLTPALAHELSVVLYGLGILACSRELGDVSQLLTHPKILYTVAPRPYVSGAFADIAMTQTTADYLPSLENAESLPFEERVKLGFKQAMSEGLDFFFGMALVLVATGDRFRQSSAGVAIRPLLAHPRALLRLARGLVRSKLAGRQMLPKDLWKIRGIISSGLDSCVYRDKIKELWGRYPLDVYMGTEFGVMATQTCDYNGMTFLPNLNFLEFIPEEEHFKWQLDHSYQPKTLLLDEVKTGENYEMVITNFHGGAMVRYRVGDMVRITSRRNDALGIDIPQMVFERRVDGLLDFVVVRVTEKTIWQAIESTGIAYEDWTAYKEPKEPVLKLFIELKDGHRVDETDISTAVCQHILNSDDDAYTKSSAHDDLATMINFRVETTLLPPGTFAGYAARRQAEGADLAHLKPPHINPSDEVLTLLITKTEKAKVATEGETGSEKIPV